MSVAVQNLQNNAEAEEEFRPDPPDISHLITEDDTPVDNMASEKNYRLLTEPLYSSWKAPGGVSFLVAANVGMYESPNVPAIVPDVFLSVDVKPGADLWLKENRCYLFWIFGKPPEVAIELVSDRNGLELSSKLRRYARMRVTYYVVYDPAHRLSDETLQCFELRGGQYEPLEKNYFPSVQLGVVVWNGEFEGIVGSWLRWCDSEGKLIPTGNEKAETAAKRAAKLAEKLRAMGINPDED